MPHINLTSYGVCVDVEVEDDTLRPAVESILPPGWQPSDAFPEDGHFTLSTDADGRYAVLVDGAPAGSGLPADVAIHVLDAQVRLRIATLARDRIFVHAGVVALEDRALLLPGSSFCGKSTLVAALVERGATYYSDEYAVLDEDGLVHPFARQVSIRPQGERYGAYASVESLGGSAGRSPVRPAVIAVTVYKPGARWQPQARAAGFGALALLTNAVPARERSTASVQAVSRAASSAQILEGARGEAGETAEMLVAALAMAATTGDT